MSRRRTRRRERTAVVLLLLAACANDSQPQRTLVLPDPSPAGPSAVVVVSIAGLTAERYRGPSPAAPTVAAMAEAGVSADAVRSVAPASRYPAHATLGSGRRPAAHGVVADRRLGERGVEVARYSDAEALRAPTLWSEAAEAGLHVATLGWPSTNGAKVTANLPDAEPAHAGETWLDALRRRAEPAMLTLAEAEGAVAPEAAVPGAARDAVLVSVACRLIGADPAPQILFVHLSQTAVPLHVNGADAPESRAAFASADQQVARLMACVHDRGALAGTAFVVVGDHGVMSVHTLIAPNAALAEAGLLTPARQGRGLVSWAAVSRSNGGSAFVYAREGDDAILARHVLEQQAEASGAFRVVSAQEMLAVGADPDAWFGLGAEPGFVFSDDARGPLLRPAATRGGGGYLPDRPEMDAGFVAWGPGIARGVRIPVMDQIDVAPTLAPLMGVALEGAEGHAFVGVLRLPRVSATPKP